MKKATKILVDPNNVRVHDQRNKDAIKKSLETLGAGRSIVMDANNVLIAGNGVFEQALELGIPVKVIETDGKTLVAIKRTDLQSDDQRRKALALADNKTSDLSVFDENSLARLLSEIDADGIIAATGFSDKEIEELLAGLNEVNDGCTGNNEPETEPPADTQCVIGPFRFPIPRPQYERWIEEVRQGVGFDNESIIQEIQRRLKL
jgi:hypothetical protein